MRELIKQIAEQAGFNIVDLGWGPMIGLHEISDGNATPEVEKLVGLIVQECYRWAKENGGIPTDEDHRALKEHFGIK